MEWHPEFKAGRTRIRVSFTGGHLSAGGCTPAAFETSDPVVQAVIEASAAYRSGRIASTAGHPPAAPAHAAPALTPLSFQTLGEAQDYLQNSKGVRIDEVLTLEACLARAAQLGISLAIKNR